LQIVVFLRVFRRAAGVSPPVQYVHDQSHPMLLGTGGLTTTARLCLRPMAAPLNEEIVFEPFLRDADAFGLPLNNRKSNVLSR
jgi:hypothetical protein